MNDMQNIDKEIEETKLDLIEVKAYRALQSTPFDFGTGVICYDGIYGSEDAYYEMEEQELEDYLCGLIWEKRFNYDHPDNISKKKFKRKPNKYLRKKMTLQKYKKLSKSLRHSWYGIYYNKQKQRYIRIYFSGARKFIHKQSEKKIRKSNNFKLKGSNFKKVYDFWWELD